MKTKSSSSTSSARRCEYRTATGRRCCSLAKSRSTFCQRHAAAQKELEASDYAALLLQESSGFQTARGINFSLGDLYTLLAQGRISPRRAAVLTHISSLLLRSLTAMDKDPCPKAHRVIDIAAETDAESGSAEVAEEELAADAVNENPESSDSLDPQTPLAPSHTDSEESDSEEAECEKAGSLQ